MYPELDAEFLFPQTITAFDEVGRGPLAGPVVSAGVKVNLENISKLQKILHDLRSLGVTDSKKLSTKKRSLILQTLQINIDQVGFNQLGKIQFGGQEISFVICEYSAKDIDDVNILQASLLSMKKALNFLTTDYHCVTAFIDGNKKLPDDSQKLHQITVVGGDAKSPLIGLASIIAKEKRDLLMNEYGKIYPAYGFNKNAGYPTKAHREAIQNFGPCPIHRRTFAGVKEFI